MAKVDDWFIGAWGWRMTQAILVALALFTVWRGWPSTADKATVWYTLKALYYSVVTGLLIITAARLVSIWLTGKGSLAARATDREPITRPIVTIPPTESNLDFNHCDFIEDVPFVEVKE